MRGGLAAGIAEVLLLMSLTLAGVRAATIMLTITKVELIIEDTARLKPKWQNNVNVFWLPNPADRPSKTPSTIYSSRRYSLNRYLQSLDCRQLVKEQPLTVTFCLV